MFLKKLFLTLLITLNARAIYIEYISDQNVPTETYFGEIPLGGLSGIAYIEGTKYFYVNSDDKGKYGPVRIYRLLLTQNNSGKFEFQMDQTIALKNHKGKNFKKKTVDFEDIRIMDGQYLILPSEGLIRKKKTYHPYLSIFDFNGNKISQINAPEKVFRGFRDNKSLESVAISPKQDFIYTATESFLHQDTPNKNFPYLATRLIQYRRDLANGGRIHQVAEYVYPITGPISNHPKSRNGLASLLSLSKNSFLSLEKGVDGLTGKYKILLYETYFDTQTTNVINLSELPGANFNPMKKRLIMDFDSIIPYLSKSFQSLDNIEGMTLGPWISSTERLLIFVSDNNFHRKQRTQFLFFKVRLN